ncbi:hypothetical protein GW17_00024786 [Ensete ventricosum]|nr:hypothetical protein GW17_00024786 [Ensete ventricosum]RZR96749.1 hypothetical protein BHM03_00025810 [Ensete ventricosum]
MVNDGEAEHDPQLGVADPLARRDLDPPEPAAVPSLAAVEVVLPAPLPQPLQCALMSANAARTRFSSAYTKCILSLACKVLHDTHRPSTAVTCIPHRDSNPLRFATHRCQSRGYSAARDSTLAQPRPPPARATAVAVAQGRRPGLGKSGRRPRRRFARATSPPRRAHLTRGSSTDVKNKRF